MISVLMNIFDTRASLMSLLKTMIDREIANTGTVIQPYWQHMLTLGQRTKLIFSEAIQHAQGFYPRLLGSMATIICAT